MIVVRKPNDLYNASGQIKNGTFSGKWHFWFDKYRDPAWVHFGTLRVFNDDILSPGAIWPLHPHKRNEVVTYVAKGEFKHADEQGEGGIMKKGDVQHTTIGTGMWHSEINNKLDQELRFIQMWFFPEKADLEPSVSQRSVKREQRTNQLLTLVSSLQDSPDILKIRSAAEVYSCYLENDHTIEFIPKKNWGVYLVLLEGHTLTVHGKNVFARGAVKIVDEEKILFTAKDDIELLLVHVSLKAPYIDQYVAHYPKS